MACVVQPGSSGFQKVFFGNEEIAIPVASRSAEVTHYQDEMHVYCACSAMCIVQRQKTCAWGCSILDAVKAHPKADVFINFASMRRSEHCMSGRLFL